MTAEKMKPMSIDKQIEAVNELAGYDHCFISEEGVAELTAPFGFKGSTFLAHDSRDEIKGLTLPEGKPMEGQDAGEVAKQICRHLGVDYPPMFGRGSQLRVCIDALRTHLENRKKALEEASKDNEKLNALTREFLSGVNKELPKHLSKKKK